MKTTNKIFYIKLLLVFTVKCFKLQVMCLTFCEVKWILRLYFEYICCTSRKNSGLVSVRAEHQL